MFATVFTVIAAFLALWSLWWIVNAARTNPGERDAEVQAREALARGEGWVDEDGETNQPEAFSDTELRNLSDALAAQSPEEAGVEARPAPKSRRHFGR